ncbi:EamA family transporter [Neobacillus cucumis]|uniref:EamA family transporter n=1 Tax=Neobacillus cucumis TaxID=1740721 RepID=UPI002E1EE523|nr:EamA family transporter [Neobacillus cucumis]MED4225417.1 EamA family transporter [Neobacillus cucumis]
MKQLSRSRTVLLLIFLVILWGINWPLSKIALSYTPPILFAGLRTVLGGIILLGLLCQDISSFDLKKPGFFMLFQPFLTSLFFTGCNRSA